MLVSSSWLLAIAHLDLTVAAILDNYWLHFGDGDFVVATVNTPYMLFARQAAKCAGDCPSFLGTRWHGWVVVEDGVVALIELSGATIKLDPWGVLCCAVNSVVKILQFVNFCAFVILVSKPQDRTQRWMNGQTDGTEEEGRRSAS